MNKASIRFSPNILARLGEELNQSADQSIAELVKNAYDADALLCEIELKDVGRPGGTIIVSDNGDGMDAELIRDRWLVLGRSTKTSATLTTLGRTPAGSKGLGRLAALRMGKAVTLQSVQRANPGKLHELVIDWSRFDNARVVEDVELEITTIDVPSKHGTRTQLDDLRTAITSDELRKLARSLLLLTDPFGDKGSGFEVKLICPEFSEIESLLKKKYFDDADFHLKAELDASGFATAKVLDWQGNELAKTVLSVLRKDGTPRLYDAPEASLDVWIFLLGSDAGPFSARKAGKGEIQSWLRHFGGVHIYQDGIRVSPYGNPGNDWLEMNLSRARSPEERPSTNTSIGRILLKSSGSNALNQKTDRSGFIENLAFYELRQFAKDALDWLARWRLDIAERRRSKERTEAPKIAVAQRQQIQTAIAQAPANVRKMLQVAFTGYEKSRDKEADSLRKEVQLYRTLSTAGITAATFSHESQGNPIKRVELGVNALKHRVPTLVDPANLDRLMKPIEDIEKATLALATLGTATLSLVKGVKRRIEKVSIHQTLEQLLVLMDPFFSGMTTGVVKNYSAQSPFLRTSQAAVESIFANLINNSLAAFERAGTENRVIQLTTVVNGDSVQISVADSGPGIVGHALPDIWLPGVSGKAEGTGLGLTIVRDTVRDMGGDVRVESPGALGGAEFIVTLPILGIE